MDKPDTADSAGLPWMTEQDPEKGNFDIMVLSLFIFCTLIRQTREKYEKKRFKIDCKCAGFNLFIEMD